MTKSRKQQQTNNPAHKAEQQPAKYTLCNVVPIVAEPSGRAYQNDVITVETAARGVFFTLLECRGEGGFIAPHKKYQKEFPEEALREWSVVGIFERICGCNGDTMKVSPTRQYPWEVFLVHSEEDPPSTSSISKRIARCFTEFSRRNPDSFRFPQRYKAKSEHNVVEGLPVNEYISNEDTLTVMKMMYRTMSLQEIIESSDEIVPSFFVDQDEGLALIESSWE